MFLNHLSSDEKRAFISLAVQAAEVNGLLENEERQMLEAFRIEMGIGADVGTSIDAKTALALLAKGSERSRRIVFLELLALLKSGEGFDEQEREHARNLQEELGLDDDTVEQIDLQLGDYEYVYVSLCETVLV